MYLSAAEQEKIGWLRGKARAWVAKVKELQATPATGELAKEKKALVDFALKIVNMLRKVGITFDEFKPLYDQMGFIPFLVGGAIIAGAAAAITKWTLDYNKFKAKIAEQKRLEESGMPPQQAAAIINETLGEKSFIAKMMQPKMLLPLGALGAYLYFRKR